MTVEKYVVGNFKGDVGKSTAVQMICNPFWKTNTSN